MAKYEIDLVLIDNPENGKELERTGLLIADEVSIDELLSDYCKLLLLFADINSHEAVKLYDSVIEKYDDPNNELPPEIFIEYNCPKFFHIFKQHSKLVLCKHKSKEEEA